MACSFSLNNPVASRSGETYRNLYCPETQFSNSATISCRPMPEYTAVALIPTRRRLSTWSRIKAISGVMTRQIPSIANAGTWKVTDLPPPVGIRPSVSLPAQTEWIISSCRGRKAGYPQYFPKILW
ncbi:unknown [Parabacteroides merdae CAG:48]|nr:unknown [Parabacteroides merdae CAG:48]